MKLGHYFLIVWLFSCGFADQAAEPTSYHLDLNRPPPHVGDEFARKIYFFYTLGNTNWVKNNTNRSQDKEQITNTSSVFDLQGREKILDWNVADNSSTVQITLDHLFGGHDGSTNEFAKPGTQLTGDSFLNESFYKLKSATLPEEARLQLEKLCKIRPRDFNEFANIKIPQPASIGQIWEIPPPTNITAMSAFVAASSMNEIQATGQFVGITNLFGLDCFHLQIHIKSTNAPAFFRKMIEARLPLKIKTQLTIMVDLIVPLDMSHGILMKSYKMDFSTSGDAVIDKKYVVSARGLTTMKIIYEDQPLPYGKNHS
jgi:hypothetical protein